MHVQICIVIQIFQKQMNNSVKQRPFPVTFEEKKGLERQIKKKRWHKTGRFPIKLVAHTYSKKKRKYLNRVRNHLGQFVAEK